MHVKHNTCVKVRCGLYNKDQMGLFHPEMLYESEEKGCLGLADTESNGLNQKSNVLTKLNTRREDF